MNPTFLDFVVIGVVLLSAILAFVRGFTREMFSLLGWVGAAAAAWFLLPYTEPFARQIVDDVLASRIIASVAVFIVVLFAITFVSAPIAGRVRESKFNSMDQLLGGLFGVARGAVLIVLGYVVLILFYPKDSQISWMRDAVSKPYLEQGLGIAEGLLPEGVIQTGRKAAQDLRTGAEIKKKIDDAGKSGNNRSKAKEDGAQ
ncbi:MAG: CvpA family protein [Rhodospirillaceae bacterium]|nr:CvpA family protein [Rhodospirillaceae bacterium]